MTDEEEMEISSNKFSLNNKVEKKLNEEIKLPIKGKFEELVEQSRKIIEKS